MDTAKIIVKKNNKPSKPKKAAFQLPQFALVRYLRREPHYELREIAKLKAGTVINGQEIKDDMVLAMNTLHRGLAYGVLIAVPVGDSEYSIGYSVINPEDVVSDPVQIIADSSKTLEKVFDHKKGLRIAVSRAESKAPMNDMPYVIDEKITDFIKRCDNYYRGCTAGDKNYKGLTIKNTIAKRNLVNSQSYLRTPNVDARRSMRSSEYVHDESSINQILAP